MDLKNDLRTTLERIGGTADDVAAAVRANGVLRVRNTVWLLIPVVWYLVPRVVE